MPSGLQHGINIIDNHTVTLVLYEKDKDGNRYYDYAYVMGDFIIGNAAMMKTLKCIMTNQQDVGGLL